jgi:formylglycine-generating enzyme required for sulfatase activity
MPADVRNYVTRIRSPGSGSQVGAPSAAPARGAVIGTGFLVAPRTVVTCAHVVARSLGEPDDLGSAPDAPVSLDFPLLDPTTTQTGRVTHGRPTTIDGGDIAVIELERDPPPGAAAARLMRSDEIWGHTFRALGFPRDDGVWASGILRERQAAGWIQVEATASTGYRIEPGFSGAPVVDDVLGGVIGMAVGSEGDATVRAAYLIPTETILEVLPELANRALAACPYRSLRAFTRKDHDIFWGRSAFIEDRLLPRVRSNAFVAVVVGSSGSGKSSAVFAGLLPELEGDPAWATADFRPGARPFDALAAALEDWLEPAAAPVDRILATKKLGKALFEGDIGLTDVIDQLAHTADRGPSRYLLVADQFEELFSRCPDPDTRQRFMRSIAETVIAEQGRQGLRLTIVLTMRADFLESAMDYGPFAAVLKDSVELLGAMTEAELREAIEKPAAAAGVRFAPGLVDRIIDDVGDEAGRLPLMQFALTLLWGEQQAGELTHAGYNAIGEVGGALANHAESVILALGAERGDLARRLFTQLAQIDAAGKSTKRVARRDELSDDAWQLAQDLSYQRLVVTGRDPVNEVDTVELIHETLLTNWATLKQWLAVDHKFRAWQDQTRVLARQWMERDREEGGLLRGAFLADAEQWLTSRPEDVGQSERSLIEASIERRETDAAARESELVQKVASERRLKRISTALTVLTAVAAIAVIVALVTQFDIDIGARLSGASSVEAENPFIAMAGGLMVFGTEKPDPGGEQALQPVTVDSMAIQKTEVTNAQYRRCVQAAACKADPVIRGQYDDPAAARRPVVQVTAYHAASFCSWLGGRLPTSAEWERAARDLTGRLWPWGNEPPTPAFANLDPSSGSADVGTHPAGSTPEGVLDLVGNVAEWTSSQVVQTADETYLLTQWDGNATTAALTQRGGSWGTQLTRITEVQVSVPTEFGEFLGFRCVRSSP